MKKEKWIEKIAGGHFFKNMVEEQKIFTENFEKFIKEVEEKEFQTYADLLISDYMYTSTQKSFDDYYICCFMQNNFNNKMANDNQMNKYHYVNCSLDEIVKRFKANLSQIKRPLGLYIEYKLVEMFKLEINNDKRSTGQRAWDFKIDNQKIDLKICFLREYYRANNQSIYNRSYVLTKSDIMTILDSIVENDKKYFDELLQKIKKSLSTGNT